MRLSHSVNAIRSTTPAIRQARQLLLPQPQLKPSLTLDEHSADAGPEEDGPDHVEALARPERGLG